MLVLSRKEGEAIVIDGRIRVQIVRVSGNRVRLLVEAPREVPVDRLEVWQAKKRNLPSLAAEGLK